jgi:hypothetical protein
MNTTWETLTMSRKEMPRAGLVQAALAGKIGARAVRLSRGAPGHPASRHLARQRTSFDHWSDGSHAPRAPARPGRGDAYPDLDIDKAR